MTLTHKKVSIPLSEIEQVAFCRSEDELEAKPLVQELSVKVRWQDIPALYLHMDKEELEERIHHTKLKLGDKLVILGHHYQRDEIIKHANHQGDSFKLAQKAASLPNANYIVFCGVHFMAETASILASPSQKVILPNMMAGCSMADMAPLDDVQDAWDDIMNVLGNQNSVIPVAYMNTIAGLKELCGRYGGIICTSSNATAAMEWAYNRGEKIFFLPDQHLGRNTGLKLGIDLKDMLVWNPFKPLGGNTEEQIKHCKLIMWQGHCSVHTRFSVKQIETARQRYPDVKVIVHPECIQEVVKAADLNGSTEFILNTISSSLPGSIWAIGTEISLVNRLARSNPDKTVFCLDPIVCPCSTMYRIHPAYLCWVLDELLEGKLVNEIRVNEDTRKYSKIALTRMLSLG